MPRRRVLAVLAAAVLAGTAVGGPAQARTAEGGAAVRAAGPPRVVAVGDLVCEPGEPTTRTRCRDAETAALTQLLDPDRVVVLGDAQYESGTLAAFEEAYDATWGAFLDRTLPVPGNHEYRTPGAAGYHAYFGREPGSYAVDLGAWRLYLLDANCGPVDCREQVRWLRADLAANPRTCSLMALHVPRFSSGEHGSDASMARFWRPADAAGVDVALAGHDHSYERFRPMDADGAADADGVLSFVSGLGGKSLYGLEQRAPGSRVFLADRPGVLELVLHRDRVAWRFLSVDGGEGDVRDEGSRRCR